jgi:YVTN family beta-propeller protein
VTAYIRSLRPLHSLRRFGLVRWVGALALGLAAVGAQAEIAVVLNSQDATVSVIQKAGYQELRRIPVGKEPHHLMQTPAGAELIVASSAGNELVFLDPSTGEVKRRIANIADPYQIGFSPDGKWFVVNALRLNRVDIYAADGFRLVKRIPLRDTPSHMAFNRAGSHVFVTLQESDEIAAIDLARGEIDWRMPIGRQPAGIWMTPDDKHLLVGVMGRDYVDVVDWRARKSVKRIVTAQGAHNFQALGDRRHVLVSNRAANSISVVDQQTLTVVDTFPVPGGPDDMEVSLDGKELWVTNRWARSVSVVDLATRKVVRKISVGRSPHGIFFVNAARE